MAQALSSRCVLLRAVEFATDGFLCAGADRRRCPHKRCRGPRGRCVLELCAEHAGGGRGKYCAVRLGFRQIDGFHWLDADEERLKQIQSSFRGAPLGASPESITTIGSIDSGFTLRVPRNDGEQDWADRIVAARKAPSLHLAGRLCPRHGLAKTRADPAGGCRCLPLHRARPPRGAMGGAEIAR